MKHTLYMLALLSFAPACIFPASDEDGAGGGGGGVDAGTGGRVDFQPFLARTRSLGLASNAFFQLSTTDTIGPIACGVAKDQRSALGTSGHQIIASVGFASGSPCPTGTHSMRSGCSTQADTFQAAVDEDCAYYRRYSAQGQLLGTVAATAGAITVTGNDASCTFTINLSFSGEAYTDGFTLTNGLDADPWCKQ